MSSSSSSFFPTSQERTVASSLLLLHTTPPSPSFSTPTMFCSNERKSGRNKSFQGIQMLTGSSSNSDASSLSNDHAVSSVSFFSATARYRQMKFKIARKIRSKVTWTSVCSGERDRKAAAVATAAKVAPGCNNSIEALSCLSSNSSGVSNARSLRYESRGKRVREDDGIGGGSEASRAVTKRAAGSPHLRRRGEAILRLLSVVGGSSELKIRQMLGDSPDTSKALRMLLRGNAVKRSGSGGRHDPYVYMITDKAD